MYKKVEKEFYNLKKLYYQLSLLVSTFSNIGIIYSLPFPYLSAFVFTNDLMLRRLINLTLLNVFTRILLFRAKAFLVKLCYENFLRARVILHILFRCGKFKIEMTDILFHTNRCDEEM